MKHNEKSDDKKIYKIFLYYFIALSSFFILTSFFYMIAPKSGYFLYIFKMTEQWPAITLSKYMLLSKSLDICLKLVPFFSVVGALSSFRYIGFNKDIPFSQSVVIMLFFSLFTCCLMYFILLTEHSITHNNRYYALISMNNASLLIYFMLTSLIVHLFSFFTITAIISIVKRAIIGRF